MLERQQSQLIAGIQELYRRTLNNKGWACTPSEMAIGAQPSTHQILEELGILSGGWDEQLNSGDTSEIIQSSSCHTDFFSAPTQSPQDSPFHESIMFNQSHHYSPLQEPTDIDIGWYASPETDALATSSWPLDQVIDLQAMSDSIEPLFKRRKADLGLQLPLPGMSFIPDGYADYTALNPGRTGRRGRTGHLMRY